MATQSTLRPRSITSIDKREDISQRDLVKEYVEPGIPVVLKNAARKWEAMGMITPEFMKTRYGHLTKVVKGVTYTMSEFIDLMMTSTPEHPAPYPFNFNVEYYFPELRKYFKPELVYGKLDRINHPLMPRFLMNGTEVYEMFLGGNGDSFPFLHIDALYLHNQLTQLYGSKDFIMYPPEQTRFLYPRADNPKVSQVDVLNPDYDRFPLFKEVQPLKVTVEQGETLMFSTGWWHVTQIHGPCISMGRAHLNSSNWNQYLTDEHEILKARKPLLALPSFLYGKLLGQLMNLQEKFA